jgi:hypothetical protein
MIRYMTSFSLALVVLSQACSQDGFQPMFNGKDLSGWTVVNGDKSTWSFQDGKVVTSGKPIGFMRTEKHYENFELEMEWMHINKKDVGNSGLFVWGDPIPAVGTGYTRGIEVQVLVNYPDVGWATNHGDIFSIWGAKCKPDRVHPKGIERCLPSENRCKGGGEWNHYKVIANHGTIKLHVNGKEVSGVSNCSPCQGYLALESEGAECHFRNVKIKELPTSNPKDNQVADLWKGHLCMVNGLNLAGWKVEGNDWTMNDGVIKSKGSTDLVSEKNVNKGELIFDWKLPKDSKEAVTYQIGKRDVASPKEASDGQWHRHVVTIDGEMKQGSIRFKSVKNLEIRNLFLKQD